MFNLFGSRLHQREPEPGSALEKACEAGELNAIKETAPTAEKDDLDAALCRACKKGKVEVIKTLFEIANIDVNATHDGCTALFWATTSGEPDVVKLLLDRGADVTIKSDHSPRKGHTPLHAITKKSLGNYDGTTEDVEKIKKCASLLLKAGCNINVKDSHGYIVLHDCLHRRMPIGAFLAVNGADPNAQCNQGGTPMHFFFDVGEQPETLKVFMDHGARLDIIRKSDGHTPLHTWVSQRRLDEPSLLQPYVSDWNIRDGHGNTLLHTAAKSNLPNRSSLETLLALGLDPNARNKEGCMPIHMLNQNNALEEGLGILCAAGADIEAKDYQGRTLLARTDKRYGRRETFKLLVERGANINTQDYKGNGILHRLIEPCRFENNHLDLLLSLGADPEMQNFNGDTFMHRLCANLATISSDSGVLAIKKLLDNGMSPTVQNFRGQTPLHILCSQVSQHYFAPTAVPRVCAVEYLLDAGLIKGIDTPDSNGVIPIHFAATISEILVAKLIAKGADTTTTTNDGRNLLHIASTARQSNVIGLLLEHYASIEKMNLVNGKCNKGRTPLHEAVRSGRIESVSLLLKAGADVNAEDSEQFRVIFACSEFTAEEKLWATSDDTHNMFDTLIAGGVLQADSTRPHPPSQKVKKRSSLQDVQSENDTTSIGPIIRLLVSHGADLSPSGKFSKSIIDAAIWDDCPEMLVELDRHVKEGEKDWIRRGFKADYMALRWKQLPGILDKAFHKFISSHDIARVVLDCHFEELFDAIERNLTIVRQDTLSTVLGVLARYGYYDLFGRIGWFMTEQDWTNGGKGELGRRLIPYLLAAAQRELPNLEVIKVIVEIFRADVNITFTEGLTTIPEVFYSSKVSADRGYKPGDTVLHYLAQGGHWWHQGAIKYLLEHGADPNARDKQGKTPLGRALQVGHYGGYEQKEIVRILLEGGADPNITATCGWTPLGMAAHDIELVKLLHQYGARPSTEHPMELFGALGNLNLDVLSAFLDMGINPNTTVLSDAQPHWHTWRVRKIPNQPNYILHPLHYISMEIWNDEHTRHHAIPMIKHLLARGADPFSIVDGQRTILHEVLASGGIFQPYLEVEGLDLERRDQTGQTLLLAGACSTKGSTFYATEISLLPSMNTSINPADWQGDDQTRAMTLYQAGADLTAVDNVGNNVLHWLVQHKEPRDGNESWVGAHQATILLFLETVPELAIQRNRNGNRPWDIAKGQENGWVLDVLEQPGV